MSTFSTYDSTVNSFYLAFYGRPADPAGLKFWSQQLAANNGELGAITQAFATSEEAQTRFGSDDAGARIAAIYEQLFNRGPDAAGLKYWTGVVESGNASLADVSIAILKGAQGSDETLSSLRQKAADAFTAAVEDGSSQYSGYASIEAARVLVRAVTADATEADLANLVKSAVSFADTATRNPKVVDAIATGSTLLGLFDTARGLKDPIKLAQALADTAKAAAGDPVTLESLLRGGGMDKVLKVMPTKATLTDVVEALAKGGLPAAVEVVYPTKPVVPTPSKPMELQFDSVSQGVFDTKKDNITNVDIATVKFTYTGSDLKAGQSFQYSIDGEHWTSIGVSANAATNTVTIKEVNLTGAPLSHAERADFTTFALAQPVANVITKVQLRAVDAALNVIAKAEGEIEYDGTPPSGFIEYQGIVYGNSCTLSDPTPVFTSSAILDHDVIQWHIEGDSDWIDVDQIDDHGTFKLPGLDLNKAIDLRIIDAAGNVGQAFKQTFIPVAEEPVPHEPQPQPPALPKIVAAQFNMNGSPARIALTTDAGPVTDLASASGLTLDRYVSGPSAPAVSTYTSRITVTDGQMKFALPLAAGMYSLEWTSGTFTIGSGDNIVAVDKGGMMFAGGIAGVIQHSGFQVSGFANMDAAIVRSNTEYVNEAFFVGSRTVMVESGGGHDVIANDSGTMNIVYSMIDNDSSDIVFGFNPDTDSVRFTGTQASAIDRNHNGVIDWNTVVTDGKVKVGSGDEGVSVAVNINGYIKMGSAAAMETTASTLRGLIDVTDVAQGQELLILASDRDLSGALFRYMAKDENGQIDADELSAVAMFFDGVPTTGHDEIVVVGTELPPPP